MAERNLDFDAIVERRNTNSLKYDFAVQRGKPKDVLPLWVADMDFQTSSYVQDAVREKAEHGIWGYSEVQESYFEAIRDWMFRHHGWQIEASWLVKTPGVVFALAMAIRAFTRPGEGVMIQQPVYYPFSEVIWENGRKLVDNTLVQGENGRYEVDFSDFEEKIVKEQVKLFILCNPHNPTGRAWSKEELTKMGDICYKHQVIVVSDEIHSDFVFQGKHQVFADVKEEYKRIIITCTSPSKTFNLAGLQVSNIFIADEKLRARFKKEIAAAGYSQLNVMGLVACEAAYRNGEEWYRAVHSYIWQNILYTKKFLEEHIPQIKMREPEGTYLIWLDCRGLNLTEKELDTLIIQKAGLWLDSGAMFGKIGAGFQRINVACPRATLETALSKLAEAVENEIRK